MPQNGQTYFNNLAKNIASFLKCVWPYWEIMHQSVKRTVGDHSRDNKQNLVQIQQNKH